MHLYRRIYSRILLDCLKLLARLSLCLCLLPLSASGADVPDRVILSGSISQLACAAACGICCPTHRVVDSSGILELHIGNSFVDLGKISDDGETHTFSGYFYQTTGQCSINECTLFAVETVDQQQIAEPSFDPTTQRLSIQSIVVGDVDESHYRVTLAAPFNVDAATEVAPANLVDQGGDCSGENAICGDGTVCLTYFGIAGPQIPAFMTCEIPCSHPGAACPTGQSCTTVADGPGQVCVVD